MKMRDEPTFNIGRIAGLQIRVKPSAIGAALLMGAGLFLFLSRVLRWRPWTVVGGSVAATAIHYLSELWHQFGHARAAQASGFPMQGVTFVGPLGRSDYPRAEGLLPAETHIQRALGGPLFSFLLALAAGALTAGWTALPFRPAGGLPLFLAFFTFLDNLLVYTLGALLPLGFTDGSTLLNWWNQSRTGARIRLPR